MDRMSGKDCLRVRGAAPSLSVEMDEVRDRGLRNGRCSPQSRPLALKPRNKLFRLARELIQAVEFANHTVGSIVVIASSPFTICDGDLGCAARSSIRFVFPEDSEISFTMFFIQMLTFITENRFNIVPLFELFVDRAFTGIENLVFEK
jgi:hypothetical protein